MTQDSRKSDEQEYEPVTSEESGTSKQERDDIPNPETGVGLSTDEGSSFEPEEDPEAAASSDPES